MTSRKSIAARCRMSTCPIVLFLLLSILFLTNGTSLRTASSAPAPTQTPSPSPSPSQGTCRTPQAITGVGLFSFNNTNAGTTSEGQTFAGCNFEGDPRIEHDVWYRWTASCTGPVTIQTCGLTSVDTKLAVYNTPPCAQPATITAKEIESAAEAEPLAGCNDDECGLQSSVTFQAVAGSQYLIQLGTAPNTAGGVGQFRITCDPPPRVSCCLPGASCQNVTAAECLALGGSPGGPGSSCADNTVRPRPVDDHHENIVPLAWQPKHRNWNLDANQNFVEDQIEQTAPDARIDILIALNRVPRKQDLTRFSLVGTLGTVYRYIPVVHLRNIRVADAIALGQDQHVAHVQLNHQVFPTTDISIKAMKVQNSLDYPNSNMELACPNLNGAGVNIVIIDSGVDDGVGGHISLPAAFAGFDYTTNTQVNPVDEMGHGTHVAGIALGRQLGPFRGVAPAAGLIDLKVFKPGLVTNENLIIAALNDCIANKSVIGVVNMSLGTCVSSVGNDAMSQTLNNVVNAGMSVVVAMGNADPDDCAVLPGTHLVQAPAAADSAITVQAASYESNVNRDFDAIATGFYLTGPRATDNDLDTGDELKPDVTAYGTDNNNGGAGVFSALVNTSSTYVRLPGTSMAAPHVAGLAALAKQAKPTIAPLTIKELISNTAEPRGSTGWQKDWGLGLVDGFAVCEALTQAPQTDLQFVTHCNLSDPVRYFSPELFAGNPIIIEGVQNTINARIHNAGPNTAGPFKVELGFYEFGTGNTYHLVKPVDVPGLAVNQTITVSTPWTPDVFGSSGIVHSCLKAKIIYPKDIVAANDCAQHNVDIQATMSPANFKFAVVNPTNEDLTIRLVHDLNVCASNGWTIRFPTPTFTLRAGDPPRTVEAILDPGPQNTGAQRVAVTAVGVRANGTELSLGGVMLVAQVPGFPDCDHNGVADSIDIQLGSSKDQDQDGIPDECILCPSKTITVNPASLVNQSWVVNADYPPLNLTPTGGTAPYSFAVTGGALPLGMVVDPYGTLLGKPLELGAYTFQVQVTDADGCVGLRDYQIGITNCPPITLNPAAGPLPATGIHTPYSQTFTATGGCVSSFTFSVTSGALPPGLTLSPNGVLSGMVTQPGDFSFSVTATDSCGCSLSQAYTLTAQSAANAVQTKMLVISAFRENGPNGARDEFVEIFNPSTAAVTVSSLPGNPGEDDVGVFSSAGKGTASDAITLRCLIPGATVIKGRGWFLCGGDVSEYSLSNLGGNGGTSHSVQDAAIIGDIPNDAGLVLLKFGTAPVTVSLTGFFSGSNPAVVFDSVGFQPYGPGAPASTEPSLSSKFCEGPCLQPVGDASTITPPPTGCPTTVDQAGAAFPVQSGGVVGSVPVQVPLCYGESGQYQIGRRRSVQQFNNGTGSLHRDTDNNADDFVLLSPNPSSNIGQAITGRDGVTSVLGAAGPHSMKSPPILGQGIYTGAAFDLGNANQLGPGNAERHYNPNNMNPNNDPLGTFLLRIRFTNNGNAAVSGVRFRIDDITGLCGGQTGAYGPPGSLVGSTSETATQEARNIRPSSPSCQGEGSDNGLFTAVLKGVNHNAHFVSQPSDGTVFFVNGSSLEDVVTTAGPTSLSPLGGGGNNSYVINSNLSPTAVGDGVSGGPGSFAVTQPNVGSTSSSSRVLRVAFKFGVVKSGRFKLLIGREAFGPAPVN